MTREEFFKQLRKKCKHLPEEEIRQAVTYYEEYLDEAGSEQEAVLLEELNPAKIASDLTSSFVEKELKEENCEGKRGIRAVWLVLLAIFASPIALPLALAAFILALAAVIVVFAILLSLVCIAASLVICSLFCLVSGIAVLFGDWATGLFFMGIGLVGIGLGCAGWILVIHISKKSVHGMAGFLNRIFLKRRKAK